MTTNLTYTKAYEELQSIVAEIEEGNISIDDLSAKVKRAASLIKVCKAKLSSTEQDVSDILRELETPDTPEAAKEDLPF